MFQSMNESVLSAFAEPFVYKGADGDVALQGVFDERLERESFGGVGVPDRVFTLSLPQADVSAHAMALRETVQVRDLNYQIIGIDADVTGMATLTLRAYG